MKGQNSRSGGGVHTAFEGGQLPLVKSLPMMRGFTNIFRKEYAVVNLDRLAGFPADSEVTPQTMMQAGLIRNLKKPVKVLGRGELTTALTVEAHKFTRSAREGIEGAGGTVREVD